MSFTKPRFTSSCAALFEERGNPWVSPKDIRKDFPLSHSRIADKQPDEYEQRAKEIRDKLDEALGKVVQDFSPPQASFHVNPDMDQFTHAVKAKARSLFRDPKGKPIVADYSRRVANINLRMEAEFRKHRPIKVK